MQTVQANLDVSGTAGWCKFTDEPEWTACYLTVESTSLSVDAGPLRRHDVPLASVTGVDEVGADDSGWVTVEVRSADTPALTINCPTEFVTAFIGALRGSQETTAPPGWYPTADPKVLRWWDGFGWTDQTSSDSTQRDGLQDSGPGQPSVAVSEAVAAWEAAPSGRPGSKKALEAEVERLRRALAGMGMAEQAELSTRLERTRRAIAEMRKRAEQEIAARTTQAEQDIAARRQEAEQQLAILKREVERFQSSAATARASAMSEHAALVTVREEAILQEVGVYNYRHRLEDSPAFRATLDALRERIKAMAKKGGGAINATDNWTVNGSAAQGRTMVSELSKLMLRAYNSEADRLAQTMRPYKLESAIDRLTKSRAIISRLGRTMNIEVAPEYHRLRIEELELTADYLAKVEEEKEAERERKQQLREEAAARREFEAEKARLLKEQAHYQRALHQMNANGDAAAAADAQAMLAEINSAIEGVERREANHRAGYVYVISNVGSFGDRVVKVGMTRRLDPMDRVRELGDASVPFRYDVHAIVFSDDAVALEQKIHRDLAPSRVNLVNLRREFFYATPAEVRELLERHEGALLSFTDLPEAEEWHASENSRP